MVKKTYLFWVTAMFIFAMSKVSLAMMCGSGHSNEQQVTQVATEHQNKTTDTTTQTKEEAINVGNKICPVSGEKIDEANKATDKYEGKIYNFCCKACLKDFKKDPQKYIKKLNELEKKEESHREGHH